MKDCLHSVWIREKRHRVQNASTVYHRLRQFPKMEVKFLCSVIDDFPHDVAGTGMACSLHFLHFLVRMTVLLS